MEGLDDLLEPSALPDSCALRRCLRRLPAEWDGARVTGKHRLASHVHRLWLDVDGRRRSIVVKYLGRVPAERNERVARRWLPAVGLADSGPPLLTTARGDGDRAWHAYEDLGDCELARHRNDADRIAAAVRVVARIHARFARQPLDECRAHGVDLGPVFYGSSTRHALRMLESLRPPHVNLPLRRSALRERITERLRALVDEEPERMAALRDLGGAPTLLHGDLWTSNVFVTPTEGVYRVRLIDWDKAGVGPVAYDLSSFLARFAPGDRPGILNLYESFMRQRGWRFPAAEDWNYLFDSAERARLANCAWWAARSIVEGHVDWGFDELSSVEDWFAGLQPLLPAPPSVHEHSRVQETSGSRSPGRLVKG